MNRGVAWLVYPEGRLRKVLDLNNSGGKFPDTTVSIHCVRQGEASQEQVWRLDHVDEEGEAHYTPERIRDVAVISQKNVRAVAALRAQVQERYAMEHFGVDRSKAMTDPREALKLARAKAIDKILDEEKDDMVQLAAAKMLMDSVPAEVRKEEPEREDQAKPLGSASFQLKRKDAV